MSKQKLKEQRALAKKRVMVLRKLRVTQRDLMRAAPISHIVNHTRGGMEVVEAAMRLSTASTLVAFLDHYYQYTPQERAAVPLEAFALAFNIDTEGLLGSIIAALRQYSVSVVKVRAITGHPDMIGKQIEYARQPWGEKDRSELNKALGFTPSPKGPTFIGKVTVNKGEITDGGGEDAEEADLDFLFPSLSETQKKIPGRGAAALIGAGKKSEE